MIKIPINSHQNFLALESLSKKHLKFNTQKLSIKPKYSQNTHIRDNTSKTNTFFSKITNNENHSKQYIRIYTNESDSDGVDPQTTKNRFSLFTGKQISTFEKNFFLKSRNSISPKKVPTGKWSVRKRTSVKVKRKVSPVRRLSYDKYKTYAEIDRFIESKNRYKNSIMDKLKLKNIMIDNNYIKQRKISKRFIRTNSPLNLPSKNRFSRKSKGNSLPSIRRRKTKGTKSYKVSGGNHKTVRKTKVFKNPYENIKVNFFKKIKRKSKINQLNVGDYSSVIKGVQRN
jgi:hypothetical protein